MNDALLDWYGLAPTTVAVPNSHTGGPDPVTDPGTVPVVPEPSRLFLLLLTLLLILLRRHR